MLRFALPIYTVFFGLAPAINGLLDPRGNWLDNTLNPPITFSITPNTGCINVVYEDKRKALCAPDVTKFSRGKGITVVEWGYVGVNIEAGFPYELDTAEARPGCVKSLKWPWTAKAVGFGYGTENDDPYERLICIRNPLDRNKVFQDCFIKPTPDECCCTIDDYGENPPVSNPYFQPALVGTSPIDFGESNHAAIQSTEPSSADSQSDFTPKTPDLANAASSGSYPVGFDNALEPPSMPIADAKNDLFALSPGSSYASAINTGDASDPLTLPAIPDITSNQADKGSTDPDATTQEYDPLSI